MSETASAGARFPWAVVPEPAAGQKRAGAFTWPDTVLAGWEWPCIAARGAQPGPAVAVVAGVHGGEYPGILGALRLGRALNPARLRGSLLILPIVNLPAFRERSAFVTPQDGRNLNRCFPGRAAGTFSDVLALRLMRDIVEPAGALIDLHSGDVFETLASHTGYHQTGDATLDARSRALAEAFGLPWAIAFPRSPQSTGLTGNAALLGKANLIVEAGGNALAGEEDVQAVYQGLVNALRSLGMLQGLLPGAATRWLAPGTQVVAPAEGLWRPVVRLEQHVAAGDTLGTLRDLLGEEIASVTSPVTGMVLYYLSSLSARVGDPLAYIAGAEG